jgi:serine/threonine protein phosphatase PrpC
MRWEQVVQYASQSDIGLRRKNNEDAFASHVCPDEAEFKERGHLFVVADGMGGHAVGELASKMAVETVPHSFYKLTPAPPATLLRQAVDAANEAIHKRGSQNQDFQRMGTTCTSLLLTPRGLLIGHVGDSRAYRVRRDRIDQLTFDHSLVWELERKNPQAAKQLDLAAHKNVITRSLGPEPSIEVDIEGPYPVFPGDIYVLCTDGLSGQVTDEEIGGIARELSPTQACRLLVHLANLRGGGDNCTVQIVRVGELPANLPLQVEEPPQPDTGMSWGYLAGFWLAALMFVGGVSLLMFRRIIEGSLLAAGGVAGVIGLAAHAWKRRPEPAATTGNDGSQTNYWRPYRSAVAKSTESLFQGLTKLEAAIRRAAEEEQWSVPWDQHQQAITAGQAAAEQKRFAKGLRDIARAIDVLMTELPKPGQA